MARAGARLCYTPALDMRSPLPTRLNRALRSRASLALLFAMLALLSLAVACEKNNDIVAQEQIQQAKDACPKGCQIPPPGCTIKGNISAGGNKIYHLQSQQSYAGIRIQVDKGERWFCSEPEAINNGFRKSIN